jgi:Zn-finger nucleic acid-binding protein
VWLDNAAAERVVATLCQASLALAKGASDNAVRSVEPTGHQLPCPVCRGTMSTQRIANAWLDVDRCDAHGTWYDRGELERVARSAHVHVGDWRSTPAPAPPPPTSAPLTEASDSSSAEVAAEVAVHGGFVLLEVLFAMLE